MIVRCPVCEWETVEPEPEWADDREVLDEICEECARELYPSETTVP